MNLKPFKCVNGFVYLFPENHCAFCENCTDIFVDYKNGPYMFFCKYNCGDYETCEKFEKEIKQ